MHSHLPCLNGNVLMDQAIVDYTFSSLELLMMLDVTRNFKKKSLLPPLLLHLTRISPTFTSLFDCSTWCICSQGRVIPLIRRRVILFLLPLLFIE
jgi:hypothetical protein